MKDERDPLETELSALRPPAVSRELRQRIAARLVEKSDWLRAKDPDFQKPTLAARCLSLVFNRRRALLAGSLAAACLLAAVVRWGGGRSVDLKTVIFGPQPAAARAVEETEAGETDAGANQPTLLAYQRALARSPEEFEALLNKHALVTPSIDPQLVPIGAYTRSDAALHALLGDD